MRALTGMDDRKLVVLIEKSLRNLGYVFIKNQGRNVTEFEVQSPCRFIVLVENLTRAQMGFPLRSPVSVESAVELKRIIGSPEPDDRLRKYVSALIDELRTNLPRDPWKGLGPLESRRARRMWDALLEP